MKMRLSDQLAFDWLTKEGYHNIHYRPQHTPDFRTDEGDFEAKLYQSGGVSFFDPSQVDRIKQANATILVFQHGFTTPVATIPASKLEERPNKMRFKFPLSHPEKTYFELSRDELLAHIMTIFQALNLLEQKEQGFARLQK